MLEASPDAAERSMAADMPGYGARSPRQIAAFVHAALDPDSGVRNDATRALGEILRVEPALAARIGPAPYLALIQSGVWRDRNKGGAVLELPTQSKDPALLARIRAEAWGALLEMSRWPRGWCEDSRTIAARIAGIPEDRLLDTVLAPADRFLRAIASAGVLW